MNLFNYLKGQLSILEVVGEYASLKKAGLYWKGQCPFHNEKTASFTVSPHKEIYYCFGCNSGGDVITFIARVEGCTPMEAARHLIDRYQINIPESFEVNTTNEQGEQAKKRHFDLYKHVTQWAHEQLLKSPAALTYLRQRGITESSITLFQLGYFPGGLSTIKSLLTYVQQHQFMAKDLLQVHLIAEGKSVLYSSFEDRIIFPIRDHLGRHCGFGGRIFKPHDERAKYYNSRENDFFTKGSLLFGFDSAKKAIQQTHNAFIVEGYTDCIMMTQFGYTNTTATLGTSCTLDHLRQLSRYTPQITVLYDGDAAGQQAIIRLTELCWQVDLELKVISLPSDEDPASYLIKHSSLEPLIAQAKDIFEFFVDAVGKSFSTKRLSEKLQITRKLLEIIAKISGPLKQDMLLQRASKTLDIPFQSLKSELDRCNEQPTRSVTSPQNEEPLSQKENEQQLTLQEISKLEKKLFFAILNNIQLFNKESEEYLITYLPNPLRAILKKLKQLKQENALLDFIHFFDALDTQERLLVSKLLLEFEGDTEEKIFETLLIQFQKKNWKAIVSSITKKLEHAKREGNVEQEQQILEHFMALKRTLLNKDLV